MNMPRLSLSALVLAGLALSACSSEQGPSGSTSHAVHPALPSGESPTVANTTEPDMSGVNPQYIARLVKRGDALPAIVGNTLDGAALSSADLTGKTVLINVWFYH
jgi:hypothetical protein